METDLEIKLKQDPVEGGQRKTHGDRPGNHVGIGIGFSRRETKGDKWRQTWRQDPVEGRQMETDLEIMLEQDPVEGGQRETNGDTPGNHVGTGSGREAKGDKWRQTWTSGWN